MPFPPIPAVVIRLDGRMYILDEGAQQLAFSVSNRYAYRHGIGACPFAVNLRILADHLRVDPLTAVRVAQWLYPDGCNKARSRVIRTLDSLEDSAWWVLCRQTAPAAPSVERFLAACDALTAQQERLHAAPVRAAYDAAPVTSVLAAKRAAAAKLHRESTGVRTTPAARDLPRVPRRAS
ncbi:hypothetical protein [Micromonospora sp. DT227]|uniref:hypothetical protein n=1 Tax=Micromonospora sp. DT227 TaxID=3393433 RepID=UPI003CE94AB4